MRSLKIELEDLNKYIDRKTVIDLIQKIVPLIIGKKGSKDAVYKCFSYLSEFSKDSDLIKTFVIRERKAIPYK